MGALTFEDGAEAVAMLVLVCRSLAVGAGPHSTRSRIGRLAHARGGRRPTLALNSTIHDEINY